jgi:hypothetical protein
MSEPNEIPSLAEFASDSFVDRLERLGRLYKEIGVTLGMEEKTLEESRKASQARDAVSYKEWEHSIFDEQKYDLEECQKIRAEFVLVFLAMAVRELLEETKLELQRKSAALPKAAENTRRKKKRGDWLKRFAGSFSELGIDLMSGPGWDCVEEVVMARDAVVHPESEKKYRESRRKPLYLNGEGVRLTRRNLELTFAKLRKFAAWLRA